LKWEIPNYGDVFPEDSEAAAERLAENRLNIWMMIKRKVK